MSLVCGILVFLGMAILVGAFVFAWVEFWLWFGNWLHARWVTPVGALSPFMGLVVFFGGAMVASVFDR